MKPSQYVPIHQPSLEDDMCTVLHSIHEAFLNAGCSTTQARALTWRIYAAMRVWMIEVRKLGISAQLDWRIKQSEYPHVTAPAQPVEVLGGAMQDGIVVSADTFRLRGYTVNERKRMGSALWHAAKKVFGDKTARIFMPAAYHALLLEDEMIDNESNPRLNVIPIKETRVQKRARNKAAWAAGDRSKWKP